MALKNATAFAEPYTAIGIINAEGRLTGGLVFWCYSGRSINVAMSGVACLKRSVFAAVIQYVFGQLKCDRLEVKPYTRHLRRVASRVGLRYEGTARSFYGVGINAHVYSLTREDLPAFTARWALNGNRKLTSPST